MTLHTTDRTFNDDVLKSTGPVLVDFWAPWCGPCQALGPMLDKISSEISEKAPGLAKIYKINVDENPVIATKFEIRSIPTVIVFENGQMTKRFTGVQHPKVYLDALGLEVVQ